MTGFTVRVALFCASLVSIASLTGCSKPGTQTNASSETLSPSSVSVDNIAPPSPQAAAAAKAFQEEQKKFLENKNPK